MLPESVLFLLENVEAEEFAEAFLGEFDTPSVIWNGEMREHLMREIRYVDGVPIA